MSAVLRQAATAARSALRPQVRSLSTSPVIRKDLVQDLYLREVKAYKPPPAVKDAHVGNVKPFSPPSPPKAPALPADLAAELSAYDSAEPVKDTPAADAAKSPEEVGTGANSFLDFLEQDDAPKDEAHH